MDLTWLPHWTTIVALGCGIGGVYHSWPAASKEKVEGFQERWYFGWATLIIDGLLVLPLFLLGAIFLAIGWSRSPWGWSVAGIFLLGWIVRRIWQQLPGPEKPPPPPMLEHEQRERNP